MNDKTMALAPIDISLVTDFGYDRLLTIDELRRDRAAAKAGAWFECILAFIGVLMAAFGLFYLGAIHFLPVSVMAASYLGMGMFMTVVCARGSLRNYEKMRLLPPCPEDSAPEGWTREMAKREGKLIESIEQWNRRARWAACRDDLSAEDLERLLTERRSIEGEITGLLETNREIAGLLPGRPSDAEGV